MAHKKKLNELPGPDAYDEAVDSLAQIVAEELQGHPTRLSNPSNSMRIECVPASKGIWTSFANASLKATMYCSRKWSKEHEKS